MERESGPVCGTASGESVERVLRFHGAAARADPRKEEPSLGASGDATEGAWCARENDDVSDRYLSAIHQRERLHGRVSSYSEFREAFCAEAERAQDTYGGAAKNISRTERCRVPLLEFERAKRQRVGTSEEGEGLSSFVGSRVAAVGATGSGEDTGDTKTWAGGLEGDAPYDADVSMLAPELLRLLAPGSALCWKPEEAMRDASRVAGWAGGHANGDSVSACERWLWGESGATETTESGSHAAQGKESIEALVSEEGVSPQRVRMPPSSLSATEHAMYLDLRRKARLDEARQKAREQRKADASSSAASLSSLSTASSSSLLTSSGGYTQPQYDSDEDRGGRGHSILTSLSYSRLRQLHERVVREQFRYRDFVYRLAHVHKEWYTVMPDQRGDVIKKLVDHHRCVSLATLRSLFGSTAAATQSQSRDTADAHSDRSDSTAISSPSPPPPQPPPATAEREGEEDGAARAEEAAEWSVWCSPSEIRLDFSSAAAYHNVLLSAGEFISYKGTVAVMPPHKRAQQLPIPRARPRGQRRSSRIAARNANPPELKILPPLWADPVVARAHEEHDIHIIASQTTLSELAAWLSGDTVEHHLPVNILQGPKGNSLILGDCMVPASTDVRQQNILYATTSALSTCVFADETSRWVPPPYRESLQEASGDGNAKGQKEDAEARNTTPNFVYNVGYRIWKLGDLNILVRSCIDALDSEGNPLAVATKLEYIPGLGAEEVTDVERARWWTAASFELNSRVALLRLDVHTMALAADPIIFDKEEIFSGMRKPQGMSVQATLYLALHQLFATVRTKGILRFTVGKHVMTLFAQDEDAGVGHRGENEGPADVVAFQRLAPFVCSESAPFVPISPHAPEGIPHVPFTFPPRSDARKDKKKRGGKRARMRSGRRPSPSPSGGDVDDFVSLLSSHERSRRAHPDRRHGTAVAADLMHIASDVL